MPFSVTPKGVISRCLSGNTGANLLGRLSPWARFQLNPFLLQSRPLSCINAVRRSRILRRHALRSRARNQLFGKTGAARHECARIPVSSSPSGVENTSLSAPNLGV
jgi:hypothetical protein